MNQLISTSNEIIDQQIEIKCTEKLLWLNTFDISN